MRFRASGAADALGAVTPQQSRRFLDGRHFRAAHAPDPDSVAAMVQQPVHQDVFVFAAAAAWPPRSPCTHRAGFLDRRGRLATGTSGWAQRPPASRR